MQGLTTLDFQILHAIQRIFSCSVLDFLMPKITTLGNGGILWILLAIFLLILPKTRKTDTTGCRLRWLWTNWKFILEKCDSKKSPLLDRRPHHVDCNAN